MPKGSGKSSASLKIMGVEVSAGPKPRVDLQEGSYHWYVYPPEVTGVTMVRLDDLETDVCATTFIADPTRRTEAHKAWAGARHSRAPGAPWVIAHEMGERGIDPDQKLEDMFSNYGHKSVGDMARLMMSGHQMPMHLCYVLFNDTTLNGGQEKSSRYQSKFSEAMLHPIANYLPDSLPAEEVAALEPGYQQFLQTALGNYSEFQGKISDAFVKYYKPETSQMKSLDSRVLDCVRFFLLFGQSSGMSIDTSARDWSRIISDLKGAPIPFYRKFAAQVEHLFTPSVEMERELGFKAEAPSLIRHSDANTTTNENIAKLRKFIEKKTDFQSVVPINRDFRGPQEQDIELLPEDFTEGDRLVAQYLMTLWPGIEDKSGLLNWVHDLDDEAKKKVSSIIFNGHNHNHELPLWGGTTRHTLVLESFLGEDRDWNRHRANRRFAPLPLIYGEAWTADTAAQVLAKGFGLPLYLTDVPRFKGLAQGFTEVLNRYYEDVYHFVAKMEKDYGKSIDYSFVINLLPLAHQLDFWMHGDPKQDLYLTHLRVRPGGHINYRDLAHRGNRLVAESDPYLSGLALDKKPSSNSKDEFFNRS